MLPDLESSLELHCPHLVAHVGKRAKPLVSSSSLPPDYDLSRVQDHIS